MGHKVDVLSFGESPQPFAYDTNQNGTGDLGSMTHEMVTLFKGTASQM